jgi:DNA-binding winged helix-turn-helix (wHTH) protein/tetratricopeptide (TPR) repeat protein
MAVSNGTIYEFADFRLVPEDNLLLRDGEAIPLPPKAFSTLVLLLENHGHLVRKDELIEKVWEDAFVEEAAVSRCVWTIRNALGEDSKSQRFIQTVPKRGYRFVAEVIRVGPSNGSENGAAFQNGSEADVLEQVQRIQPTLTRSGAHAVVSLAEWQGLVGHLHGNAELPPHEGNGKTVDAAIELAKSPVTADRAIGEAANLSSWKGYAILAVALFAVSTTIIYLTSTGPPVFGAGTGNRIAVLPLKPIDAANRSDLYEIGVADALIYRINSIKGFVARPLSATRKYDALDQDPLAAGREQKVDYVLSSNYQIADGKIRVTSQLYDVATGKVLDTYRSEQDSTNIFGAQDAIAADFGNRIMAQFAGTLSDRRSSRGTSNAEAYRHYLQGQFLISQSRRRESVEILKKSVSLDPGYAKAWAALALGLQQTGGPGETAEQRAQGHQESLEAIKKALALDPQLSEAYSALCMTKTLYEYDFAGAEPECRRAVDLDPDSSLAHSVYGTFLSTRGRHLEAMAEAKTAVDLEPASYNSRRWQGNGLYWARRYDLAIVAIKRLTEINDSDISRHRWIVWSYELQGKYPEAFDALLGLLAAYKKDEEAVQLYKTAFQTSGWSGVLVELERDDGGLRFNSYRRAALNAQLGNKDKAFEYLEDAFANRTWEVAFLQIDPMLDTLRDDPRYAELVRRIGSK